MRVNAISQKLITAIILTCFYSIASGAVLRGQDTLKTKSPKSAMLRSAIIPGWGQLYVGKPLKSVLYFGAEAYVINRFFHYNKIYGYIKKTKDEIGLDDWKNLPEYDPNPGIDDKRSKVKEITGYNLEMNSWRPREKRNKNGWWSLGLYVICILDACVDAHLWSFPEENVVVMPITDYDRIGIDLYITLGR